MTKQVTVYWPVDKVETFKKVYAKLIDQSYGIEVNDKNIEFGDINNGKIAITVWYYEHQPEFLIVMGLELAGERVDAALRKSQDMLQKRIIELEEHIKKMKL